MIIILSCPYKGQDCLWPRNTDLKNSNNHWRLKKLGFVFVFFLILSNLSLLNCKWCDIDRTTWNMYDILVMWLTDQRWIKALISDKVFHCPFVLFWEFFPPHYSFVLVVLHLHVVINMRHWGRKGVKKGHLEGLKNCQSVANKVQQRCFPAWNFACAKTWTFVIVNFWVECIITSMHSNRSYGPYFSFQFNL